MDNSRSAQEIKVLAGATSYNEHSVNSAPHNGRLAAALTQTARVNGGYILGNKWVAHFGITRDDYARMVRAQGSKCAICGTFHEYSASLAVDHCHKTGKVRGLLCRKCNMALGFLKDDPALLRAAADYLERA